MALSSTAVVIPTLIERGQDKCPVGKTLTAVLIFQDVFAIFLLILAGSLAGGDGAEAVDAEQTSLLTTVGMAIVKGAVAFACAILLGRYAIRPLFSIVARTLNEEIFTALALLIVLAMAAASVLAGTSQPLLRELARQR